MNTFLKLFLLLYASALWASEPWYSQAKDKSVNLNVEIFLSSTCPHCHKADAFLKEIAPQNPWLQVRSWVINDDKEALIRFNQLLGGSANFSVPSIFFCNTRWIGFSDDKTTGQTLLKALHYCKAQIEKEGELKPATVEVIKRWAQASQYDTSMINTPTAPFYLLGMAFVDAISPCALFGFIAFLTILFMQESRQRQLASGFLFLIGLGIVHYLQQVYAASFYQWSSLLRVPSVLIGLVLLYFAYQASLNNQISRFFSLLSFGLAIIILSYQQVCLTNWSYLFEQWLQNQSFSPMAKVWFEMSYQLLYLVPLFLFLMLYIVIINKEKFEKTRIRLRGLGLVTGAILALILIIYPYVLSYLFVSIVLLGLMVCFFFLKRT